MPITAAALGAAAPAAGSFLSSVGGLGGVGSFLSGAASIFGKSGDGISGKALGTERVQSTWLNNMQTQNAEASTKRMLPFQYDTWIDKMYPIQQRQIQDRVNDAKQAGLHPLFALGQPSANLPSFAAGGSSGGGGSGIPGQSYTGSHKGDKLAAVGQALMAYEQNKSAIKLNDAQAAYYNSLAKKAEQGMDATATQYPDTTDRYGTVSNVPVERKSTIPGNKSTLAGQHGFFQNYVLGYDKFGNPINTRLPGSDNPSEATENVGGLILSALKKWGLLDDPPVSSYGKNKRGQNVHGNQYWQWRDSKTGALKSKRNPFRYRR